MNRSALLWTLTLGLLTLFAAWLVMALGSKQGQVIFEPGWLQAITAPPAEGAALHHKVLLFWRAPRVVAGIIVGACMAVAGQVLQGVTRNPLADPYLLGISGGAGLVVVGLHALPEIIQQHGWLLVPVAAFVGAQLATLLVLTLARGSGGRHTVLGLILGGVIINALCAALMSFLLARLDPFRLRITTIWLAGGIGFAYWHQLVLAALILAGAWSYLRTQAHRLNAFALGRAGAQSVGVDADRLMLRAALVASLLTGLGVSLGGLLGYVGLIVPHAVRGLVGNDFRKTLPVAAVAGALLLVLADGAARMVLAPEELPVGVLTALLGCPVLLILLRRQLKGARR
jgi:iron complex transport system permease protein